MWKIFLFLASTCWSQTPAPVDKDFIFPEFRNCGLVTRYASNKIDPSCLQSANNVLLDEDLSILRRNGYSKYNNTPCTDSKSVRGLWKFDATDGTHYMVILSSQNMFKTSGSGDCTQIPGAGGYNVTAEMQCVQTLGRLWCTNGSDTPFYWDGTSTATVSAMPKGKYIGTFRNRVVVANATGNLTIFYLSGELDGTDWTLQIPGKSTTAAQINISGTNDGNPISCLMGEYQNAYYVGRADDLYGLYGNDRRDFTLRKISKEIGCTEPKSIQEKNNALYWLSKRGVEKLSGTTIERVSDPVRPILDQIISAAGNTVTQSFTSQSDFTGGNADVCASGPGACMNTTISPGNIVTSTSSVTDTFLTFTSSSVASTTTTSGYLTIQVATQGFTNGTFTTGDFTNWTNSGYTLSAGTSYNGANACMSTRGYAYPAKAFGNTRTSTLSLKSGSGSTLDSCTVSWTCSCITCPGRLTKDYECRPDSTTCAVVGQLGVYCSDSLFGFIPTDAQRSSTTLSILVTDSNSGSTLQTIGVAPSSFVVVGLNSIGSGGTETGCTLNSGAIGTHACDNQQYFPSGVWTSTAVDVTLSTPTYGPFVATISSNSSQALVIQTQTSSDSINFGSFTTANSSSVIPSYPYRWVRYKAIMTTTVSSKTPTMFTPTITAATTGYYISNCAAPSSAISSFGNFRMNSVPNGGSFTVWTATGGTCAAAANIRANWTPQPINSAIAVATSTFISARILFNLNSATSVPTVNDFTFEWNEGSNRPPTASAVYRDRYWLFYTTSTVSGAYNDHALIADASDKWTTFDDVNAYSAIVYNRKLYTGDSTNSGTIFQQDSGSNDNSSNFTEDIKTADVSIGPPEQNKILKTVYIYMSPASDPTQTIQPTVSYFIDGSTTSYSLGTVSLSESPEGSGYFVAKLPVPTGTPSTFHWISFEISYTGNVGPLKIYGMRIIYEPVEYK